MSTSPYPGLRPFHRDEADIFFGRDEQVDQLLIRLGKSRFLAVVGPSGCGKSSLVHTGLLNALSHRSRTALAYRHDAARFASDEDSGVSPGRTHRP